MARIFSSQHCISGEFPYLGKFVDRWQTSEQPCPLFVPEAQGEQGPQPSESHWRSEDWVP